MLQSLSQILSLIFGLAATSAMLLVAAASWKEEEPRAMRRAIAVALLLPLPYFSAALSRGSLSSSIATILVILTATFILLLLIPFKGSVGASNEAPNSRFDERDIIFSRRELVPGSPRYLEYYRRRPEKEAADQKWRGRPGLMRSGALHYHRVTAGAAAASFKTVAAFHRILDEEPADRDEFSVDPASMSRFVKQWAKKLGAVSVGITELRPYHLYSHVGRGEHYGRTVDVKHKFAIAVTVEMEKLLLDRSPGAPTVMESAQQYLNSGAIAVQLAEFARSLGYSARAHIDGSYRVICPLVARDAGLGEIGRMGLLMTPELGPRVRLAVVTCDLPLMPDERKRDESMIAFCTLCKKCADACPSKSITFDDRVTIDGALRWRINSESCFTYWCTIGTDCGLCMRVCPYSHPNTMLHNLVRAGVRRSALFIRVALKLDDFLYGRRRATLALPQWLEDVMVERNE